jgi:predicted XRE-type DNA-binding protein
MESNNLSSSVPSEQFENTESISENTQNTTLTEMNLPTPIDEIIKKEQHSDEQQSNIHENSIDTEDFVVSSSIILPEDLNVPEELLDDDDEIHETTHNEHPSVDFSALSKEEIVASAEKLLKEKPIESLKTDFDNIKIQFYKKHKAEQERLRKIFIEGGGNPEEFNPDTDISELKLRDILKNYKDRRFEFSRKAEAEKNENLKAKQAIIEEIKVLINGNESLNDTFHQFRELQKKWRSIGLVPQSEMNNLWENYNHNVEKFYDYIKINQELRDLDLKRNLEAKIELCEKTEELLLESSVIKAFKQLQEYHFKWREIGPVPNEMRTDIWNRFKDITGKINKLHQDYFESMKASQQQNMEAKTALCEKIEEIITNLPNTMKTWEDKSKELIELQNQWKNIGFAPKKDNTRIYQRFRLGCDNFFAHKRDFYGKIKEEQNNNLQIKLDLCVQAEALKESNEWKKSTEDLINIQKKWKEVGPVPRKMSDIIWKRFRSACDTFFTNKANHYATVDTKYEDNLALKLALIDEIEKFQLQENVEDNFTSLKDYQRRWAEIGYVPIKHKEEIQNRYHKAIDKLFDSLKMDDGKRKAMKFRNKAEQQPSNRKPEVRPDRERDKLIAQLKKTENDIVLWDNNIGFFAKSKNAEVLIKEVQNNINNARAEIKELEEKIRTIDKISEK